MSASSLDGFLVTGVGMANNSQPGVSGQHPYKPTGGFGRAIGDDLVESEPGSGAIAISQPANAGRQPLKRDFLARQLQPSV